MNIPISNNSRIKPTPATTFRGVLPAVDKLLKLLKQRTPEHAVMKFLREHAVGPENAKCWKEIQSHLRKCGHDGYRQTDFQRNFVQFCRSNDFFIAAYHKGYYLPGKPADFIPYETATARRIKGEQTNLQAARALRRLQQEHAETRQCQTRTRTTARRTGANRPTATRAPRKARSKGRRSTRS